MKFSATCFLLGLASIAAAADTTTADTRADSDPFEGETPEDIAPVGCSTSASAFSSCYKPVTSYWRCDGDNSCECSSAMIEQTCGAKYCSADYNNVDVNFYCTGTQTKIIHPDSTGTPVAPSKTEATTTAASHLATQSSSAVSASSAASKVASQAAGSAPSASPAPTANAGARAIAGGVLAVAAAAAGALV